MQNPGIIINLSLISLYGKSYGIFLIHKDRFRKLKRGGFHFPVVLKVPYLSIFYGLSRIRGINLIRNTLYLIAIRGIRNLDASVCGKGNEALPKLCGVHFAYIAKHPVALFPVKIDTHDRKRRILKLR